MSGTQCDGCLGVSPIHCCGRKSGRPLLYGRKGPSFLSGPMIIMTPEEFANLLRAPEAISFKKLFEGKRQDA